jgi:hypothetical protein
MNDFFTKLGTEVRYMSEDLLEEKPEMTAYDLINFYNQKFGEMLISNAIAYLQSINVEPEVIVSLKTHYQLDESPQEKP